MLISSILFTIFLHVTASQRVIPAKDLNNITVTFGSCNKYTGDDNNHIYYRIAETEPDVWIWLGDVEYVDKRVLPTIFVYAGDTHVKKKFIDAKNSISYTHLRNKTEIIGVWDDHDYGLNNGGKYFKHKAYTKQLWLDYIDEPLESPRRKREGIYESYYIGDPTKIKVILLDVRYCKDEHSVFGGGDMLGEEQWNWLEEQLRDNKAALTLIGSGTQVLPDDRFFTETWYDESRERLLDLLKKYQVKGVVLLSGDVHYAEIMKYPCRERLGFDLYEFTSSGLTHRAGETVPASDKVISAVYPDTYNTNEDRYYERNFGIIRLSFDDDERPVVRFEVRNYYGIEVLSEDIDYPKISFDEGILNNQTFCELDVSVAGRLIEKSLESLLEGNFYPLLVIVVLTYSMVAAVIFAVVLKKIFYLICGLVAKKPKKQKTE